MTSCIESERALLEVEIASLEARLSTLRSQFNRLSPVNRLPTDLFLEIVTLIRGTPNSNFGWVRGITDVCSHWRSTALNQRELWATIFLSPRHVKLQTPIFTLLSRENGFPLRLHAPSISSLTGEQGAVTFGIRPHTLRELHLQVCSSLERLSQALCVDSEIDAPLLSTLRIESCAEELHSMTPLASFLSRQCPSLLRLRIPSLFVTPEELRGFSLTDLSLIEGSFEKNGNAAQMAYKPYDTLATLNYYGGLKNLTLNGIYLDYYEHSLPSGDIHLPMMSTLTLDYSCFQSAINILRAISTTSAVDVACLRMRTGFRDSMERPDTTKLCLSIHQLSEVMLIHCRSQGSRLILGHLGEEQADCTSEFCLEDDLRIPFRLTTAENMYIDMDDAPAIFSAFLDVVDPRGLSHVNFQGKALRVANLPFFSACSATHIKARPWGHLDQLSLATPPGITTIPFPDLADICLAGRTQEDGLTFMLWWRRRKGLPLPRLVLAEYNPDRPLDSTSRTVLPLVTSATFLVPESGEMEEMASLDDEDLPRSEPEGISSDSEDLESETDTAENSAEEEFHENLVKDRYGSWMLHPDEPLFTDEESGDDYALSDSGEESEEDREF
ncbi:hypothetical protein DL96DRAFT_1607517 [Flagelloscypha sp. PMI_526]|nr:hypothetical protein DL96DRAFT_1607517 [Flagelloscypha sp. PMI_526]